MLGVRLAAAAKHNDEVHMENLANQGHNRSHAEKTYIQQSCTPGLQIYA